MKFRIERDFLGEKRIEEGNYWGIQTQRAIENFNVSGMKSDRDFILSYVLIKKTAARVNKRLGLLKGEIADAIVRACDEILKKGNFIDQFVVDVFQAGAGTSFNMNLNEVIANIALEMMGKRKGEYDIISPNDHVNLSQSTNDTFPTAINITCLKKGYRLLEILRSLSESFMEKSREFKNVIKAGRTHLMDAVPVSMGQVFSGYGSVIKRAMNSLKNSLAELLELPAGGTAVGTGLNSHPSFRRMMVDELKKATGFPFKIAKNPFELMQSRMQCSLVSSSLRNLALELTRIANDLRLMSSGPSAGLNEIELPPVQPGSSIMPGKVNPVMAECLNMVCFQVIGNDLTVSLAVQAGQFEINVFMPVIAFNLFQSFNYLINFLPLFQKKCLEGIKVNREKCEKYALSSSSLGTVLSPILGYMKTAAIIKESKDIPITEFLLSKKIMKEHEIKKVFNLKKLIKPGIIKNSSSS